MCVCVYVCRYVCIFSQINLVLANNTNLKVGSKLAAPPSPPPPQRGHARKYICLQVLESTGAREGGHLSRPGHSVSKWWDSTGRSLGGSALKFP